MSRTLLTLALLTVTLLAGCVTSTGPAPSTPAPEPTPAPATPAPEPTPAPATPAPEPTSAPATPTPSNATPPAVGASPDEPPLDFDGAHNTLDASEHPHVVRLTNDGPETRTVRLQVSRDGALVFERTVRSAPKTTVIGQLDHVGNYTLTVSVVGGGTATETLAASTFDCNHSTTRVDLSDRTPSVETFTTAMACDTTPLAPTAASS